MQVLLPQAQRPSHLCKSLFPLHLFHPDIVKGPTQEILFFHFAFDHYFLTVQLILLCLIQLNEPVLENVSTMHHLFVGVLFAMSQLPLVRKYQLSLSELFLALFHLLQRTLLHDLL